MNNVYILGTLLCWYGFITGWGCYIISLWVCFIIALCFCYCFSGGLCQGVLFCCLDWPWIVCRWNQHWINAVAPVLHWILSGEFTCMFYSCCCQLSWVCSIYCPCFCYLPIQVTSVKMFNFIIQILLLAYGIIIWSVAVDLIWLQMPYIVYY